MGGMDDMNAPTPPMDAAPPLDAMGGEEPIGGDQEQTAPPPEGQNSEVEQFKQNFDNADPKTQAGTIDYFNSQNKNGNEEQPPMDDQMPPAPGMPTESKFNFKNIIDETFSMMSQRPGIYIATWTAGSQKRSVKFSR